MPNIRNAGVLGVLFAVILPAAYSNLIATSGGSVYFQIRTGLVSEPWYQVWEGSPPRVEPLRLSLADVDDHRLVFASATYAQKHCGYSGSSCFLALGCQASFAIQGPGIDVGNSRRRTFIRLDRAGKLAWIDQQDPPCFGIAELPPPPSLNGLYEWSSIRQVIPANGAKLANQRYGRRMITDRGQALAFMGTQLHWLDAAGAHQIRHVAGAYEAATDSAGSNIVYVESPIGKLHWIAGADEELGFTGSEPALTDDGRTLVFIAPDGSLQVYDRGARTVQRSGSETYLTFTLGRSATYGVTSDNRLVRIDLATGTTSTLLQPFPQIESADAPALPLFLSCPLICYGEPDLGLALGPGMVLFLRGKYLDRPGWRARMASVELPLQSMSDKAAWFQIPSDVPRTGSTQTVEIYNPEHPLKFNLKVQVQERVISCFGTLHQDFRRAVSAADPAVPGEIAHLFLTGLRGVEPIPDGVPNPVDHTIAVADPPALVDTGVAEPVFFGLAPGLIGIQQLDLRIRGAAAQQQTSLFSNVTAFACEPPPVASR